MSVVSTLLALALNCLSFPGQNGDADKGQEIADIEDLLSNVKLHSLPML